MRSASYLEEYDGVAGCDGHFGAVGVPLIGSLPKLAVGDQACEGDSQGERSRTQEGAAVFLNGA